MRQVRGPSCSWSACASARWISDIGAHLPIELVGCAVREAHAIPTAVPERWEHAAYRGGWSITADSRRPDRRGGALSTRANREFPACTDAKLATGRESTPSVSPAAACGRLLCASGGCTEPPTTGKANTATTSARSTARQTGVTSRRRLLGLRLVVMMSRSLRPRRPGERPERPDTINGAVVVEQPAARRPNPLRTRAPRDALHRSNRQQRRA